jgi:cytochrome c oxidase subunit 2
VHDEGVGAESGDDRGHLPQMLAIGAVASAIGVALALLIDWWPALASEEGRKIDTLYDVLMIVSVPIFVLVVTVVLYCVWRFRVRPGQEHLDGPPMHGNTRVEIIWTAIPALILVALCGYAYVVLDDIEDAKGSVPMEVRVVGEQFTWTFFYKNPRGGREIASNRLYLPTNTSVKFNVQTKDVLHDFWVPEFRLKIDAVPGITTNFKATTRGQARQLRRGLRRALRARPRRDASDGDRHARSRIRGVAQRAGPAGGGAAGTAAGGGGEDEQAGGDEPDAKALFTSEETRCGQCHTLADAKTGGTIGPNLDESLQGKDEAYIRRGIVEPDAGRARGLPAWHHAPQLRGHAET